MPTYEPGGFDSNSTWFRFDSDSISPAPCAGIAIQWCVYYMSE